MKKIKLTQGKFALVDDEDFEELNQYKWHVNFQRGRWYAVRWAPRNKDKRRTKIHMHREILKPSKTMEVDHIDRNGLNNQRHNLRVATKGQNMMNRPAWGTSKYKGVYWHKENCKWAAHIYVKKTQHFLGLYENELEAALAYNCAARKYFGEFATVNPVYRVITHGTSWTFVLDPRISITV